MLAGPVPVVLPVPEPMVLPVPEPTELPVPELAPLPALFWPPDRAFASGQERDSNNDGLRPAVHYAHLVPVFRVEKMTRKQKAVGARSQPT